jgi:acyl transferase domain-containing protein
LPTYPFERERHWLDFPSRNQSQPQRDAVGRRQSGLLPSPLIERSISHPFIGRMRSSRPTKVSDSGFVLKGPPAPDTDKTEESA